MQWSKKLNDFLEQYKFPITVFFLLIILLSAGFLIFTGRREGKVEIANGGEMDQAVCKVDIEGAVRHPGVYNLKPNDRVEDALRAAGGPLPEADLSKVSKSLAAKITDGERIIIPFRSSNLSSSAGTGNSNLININTASLSELDSLPGIGPSTAQKIIDYREAHGGFSSIEEIMNVSGIGEAKFEKIKDLITI